MTICSRRRALSLHARLARAYIALRGADAQAALLARTIKLYRSALKLTAGAAEAEYRAAHRRRARQGPARHRPGRRGGHRPGPRRARKRARGAGRRYRLVCSGSRRGRSSPAAPGRRARRRPRCCCGGPMSRRNERLLFAASERIGSAKADFLPRFYLMLSGGTQSTNLDLLNFHNSLWSYGPGLSAPVFDGGQRQAELDIARADFNLPRRITRARFSPPTRMSRTPSRRSGGWLAELSRWRPRPRRRSGRWTCR